jgi:hypothetical protein
MFCGLTTLCRESRSRKYSLLNRKVPFKSASLNSERLVLSLASKSLDIAMIYTMKIPGGCTIGTSRRPIQSKPEEMCDWTPKPMTKTDNSPGPGEILCKSRGRTVHFG